MPVLAVGGEKSFGVNEVVVMRNATVNETELMFSHSGHWLMEEQPTTTTITAIRGFLSALPFGSSMAAYGTSQALVYHDAKTVH
jgi:hypothetical protein